MVGGLVYASAAEPVPQQKKKVDFARDVLPVLRANCFQCHGEKQQLGGLRIDTKAALRKGGISGKAVLPGRAEQSSLLRRVLGRDGKPRMPMGFAPLAKEQIAALRDWIDQGAEWPENLVSKKHWAYIAPVRPALPVVKQTAWPRNPVDRFILAKLENVGLRPSPEASKETLLRRVSLDLIGLPPTPAERIAFLKDNSPDAYEKVVDRLLNSPHFGERWARPWLDLARYADSNGYEKDNSRSIWPYRDWVIRALNADMPYDQFTIEQIAGDLLPNATREQKIATGFHRNTMSNEEGGVDQDEARWLTIVDRVGTTGAVWLGTTLACAQCHDHKYDPFSTKDYYRFFAFFENCTEPTLELITPEQETKRKSLQSEAATLEKALKNSSMDKSAQEKTKARLAELRKEIDMLRGPTTLIFEEKPGNPIPMTYYRVKGSYLNKGELLEAATPGALNTFPKTVPRNRLGLAQWIVSRANPLTARVAVNRFWEQLFGHGLVGTSEDFGTQGERPTHPELLDWLAVEFMEPTQRTFGSRTAQPWSMKALLRTLVTSATYRQSSRVTPMLRERDPYNRLLARGPRFRMEAEMIRDATLSVAGLLSPKIGGPSVFPVQPDGIWNIPYSGEQWNTSPGEDRYRRGLYTFWRRTSPYPAFLTFDATSREFCTVRRVRTNTPLQAMTTLNDPAFFEAARALAKRMLHEGGSVPDARVAFGFQCVLSRQPAQAEIRRLTALYNQQWQRYRKDTRSAQTLLGESVASGDLAERAAWTVVANVLLNLDEFLTKE
jgi:hypothetical protein